MKELSYLHQIVVFQISWTGPVDQHLDPRKTRAKIKNGGMLSYNPQLAAKIHHIGLFHRISEVSLRHLHRILLIRLLLHW
jgi:hypothetical protein